MCCGFLIGSGWIPSRGPCHVGHGGAAACATMPGGSLLGRSRRRWRTPKGLNMKQLSRWQIFWGECYHIATGILWFPIVCPIVLYVKVAPIPSEWKFKRRMQAENRYLSHYKLPRDNHPSFGTLICDRPSCKWDVSRSWWTEDDIHSIAPVVPSDDRYVFKEPSEDEDLTSPFEWDEYDRWIYDTYLHPDHGKAMLVSKKFGWTFIKSQTKAAMVNSFSGGHFLEIQSADSAK
jgi:hypothetical protein